MGRMAKWREFSEDEIKDAVNSSKSFATLAKKLGYTVNTSSATATLREMVVELGLDTSHFIGQGWNKDNFDYSRFRKNNALKPNCALKAIEYLRGHQCECCNLTEWQEQPIPLEIHHKDGDSLNNELDNLVLLCPNCHALTENYCGKNINNGTNKVTDEELVNALYDKPTIRQALKSVGLTPKGGNYTRAHELIIKYNISHL